MPNRAQRRSAKSTKTDNVVVSVTVNGESYSYDRDETDWRTEAELMQAIGLTPMNLIAKLGQGNYAPFMVAGIVFLARRAQGDPVTFDQIADAIDYAAEIEFVDDATPEAPGEGEDPAAS
jgi:hypothetical protein